MNKKQLFCLILLLMTTTLPAVAGNKGKVVRLSILGDSYSTFEGYLTPDTNFVWYFPEGPRAQRSNDVRLVEQTWWHQVLTRKGWQLDTNNAFSGSTICNTGYRKEDYSLRSFTHRAAYLGEPDVILVCGATNDSWAGSPIGVYKYGDWTADDLWSFRPAMAKLCWTLREHYPNARILFLLNSELKPEINESVLTICRHYGVPCLCLEDIDKQGGHPSQKGMTAMADQIIRWINKHWKL
ncbi:MAG: hypothetical protein HUK02_04885 [Bacteroidaceae bacterium]|nr:hypothetical protein [Bacteroidaceae bacterium]